MHDCYARIGILYFFSHWMTSVSLYSQCHCFGELRGLWPAWSVTFIFTTAHWCLLKLDIQEAPIRIKRNKHIGLRFTILY